MLSAHAIVDLHDQLTRVWHLESDDTPPAEAEICTSEPHSSLLTENQWLDLVARQHRANFDLWHIEDDARTPGISDTQLAQVKRRIDSTNQLRNDLAEALDCALLDWLAPQSLPNPNAPLHSESPGLMIDRLSILALKIFHTREEADRPDAPTGHNDRNRNRLAVLEEQRADLAHCLDLLWRETLAGQRRFKLYRQLKMYNDPSLNPAVYRKQPANPVY
jgi:hypothetical protein